MHRSSRSVAIIAALILVLPAATRAQSAVRHDNSPFAGQPVPFVPVSVAKVVIESDRDMALSDSQRVQLALIQRQLDSATVPLIARLDSLKPTWRPAGGLNDLSQEQRDELVARRKAQIALVEQMTPSFVKARERVMSLLRPEQQDRANKLEKSARKRAEEFARHEQEQMDNVGRDRRRGEFQDATGRAPLG